MRVVAVTILTVDGLPAHPLGNGCNDFGIGARVTEITHRKRRGGVTPPRVDVDDITAVAAAARDDRMLDLVVNRGRMALLAVANDLDGELAAVVGFHLVAIKAFLAVIDQVVVPGDVVRCFVAVGAIGEGQVQVQG